MSDVAEVYSSAAYTPIYKRHVTLSHQTRRHIRAIKQSETN